MKTALGPRLVARTGLSGLPPGSLAIVAAVAIAGWVGVALALVTETPDWTLLGLLAAAALLTEWLHVTADDDLPDSAGIQSFSFSSGVHIAAIVLLGPFPAAVVAVFGLVVADLVRQAPLARVAFNASVFALASIAAGYVFIAVGGEIGGLELPGDLAAAAALWLTYVLVNTFLVSALVSSYTRIPLWALLDRKLRGEFASSAGEAGFGFALALFVEASPWGAIFLAPLVFGVYQARVRLAQARSETARSLESFANVVDERDPSTYRHSERVAAHLREVAEWLDLPSSETLALAWAGRLHDLGKISVDSTVLTKAGALDAEEWETMWRHPRLSAKLLRRFRFAGRLTRVVEYHHERYDGDGYYRLAGDRVPVEAFFVAVADSYDAMVSDRPYRTGMSEEEALAEIERCAGTQFHPLVARALVGVKRGLTADQVFTPSELASLRAEFTRRRSAASELTSGLRRSQRGISIAGLAALVAAVAAGELALVLGALLAAATILAWISVEALRAGALARRLAATFAQADDGRHALQSIRDTFAMWTHPTWAAIVAWSPRALRTSLLAAIGGEHQPHLELAIASWLVRDGESGTDVLWRDEEQGDGAWLAVRLPGSAGDERGHAEAFAIFAFARRPPPWFDRAVRARASDIAQQLAPPAHTPVDSETLRLRVVTGSR